MMRYRVDDAMNCHSFIYINVSKECIHFRKCHVSCQQSFRHDAFTCAFKSQKSKTLFISNFALELVTNTNRYPSHIEEDSFKYRIVCDYRIRIRDRCYLQLKTKVYDNEFVFVSVQCVLKCDEGLKRYRL